MAVVLWVCIMKIIRSGAKEPCGTTSPQRAPPKLGWHAPLSVVVSSPLPWRSYSLYNSEYSEPSSNRAKTWPRGLLCGGTLPTLASSRMLAVGSKIERSQSKVTVYSIFKDGGLYHWGLAVWFSFFKPTWGKHVIREMCDRDDIMKWDRRLLNS